MTISNELEETAAYVLAEFRKAGMKIATAESCTGGLVSAVLTSVAGSSDVFECGFVTYSNEAKVEMLGVSAPLLEDVGAVSAEVAMAMAQGALERSNADIAAAITGIAGPGGGTEAKPVGLVYVAIAGPAGTFVEELRLGELPRSEIRQRTVLTALEMIAAFGPIDDEDEGGDDASDFPQSGRLN